MAKTEYEKARAWADKRGLSAARLSELTGYGTRAILWFWKGKQPKRGRKREGKISPAVWRRFRRCCAGVEAELNGKKFDW